MARQLDGDVINEALESLGAALMLRGEHYEIVVIGGGNLIYAGLVTRQTTRDVDVLGALVGGRLVKFRPLPAGFVSAAQSVAGLLGLPPDWINIAPDRLIDVGLPDGCVALGWIDGFATSTERQRASAIVAQLTNAKPA